MTVIFEGDPGDARLPRPRRHVATRRVSSSSGWIFRVSGRALGSGKVKFTGQVLPKAKLVTYQIDIKRVITRKLNMAIADATMSVDGREIYTAEDLRVGLFTSTDDF